MSKKFNAGGQRSGRRKVDFYGNVTREFKKLQKPVINMESVLLIMLSLIITLVVLFGGFTLYAIYSSAPYVPTLNHLVVKMLEMAEVGKKDIVIDLGAGDGRIVAAAAQRGAKAIGYEINPMLVVVGNWRIRLKTSNIKSRYLKKRQSRNRKIFWLFEIEDWVLCKVWNSVFGVWNGRKMPKIYWRDFWKQDLSSATVITIFGFPNMMERLEKKLQKELKPGSRVVSHAFKFPTWQPVKREGGLLLYTVS